MVSVKQTKQKLSERGIPDETIDLVVDQNKLQSLKAICEAGVPGSDVGFNRPASG